MANQNWREKVRGVERETLDLLFEVITSEQWVKLLQVPLLHAAAQGNRGLARKLVGAGAEIGGALHVAVRGGQGEIVNDLLESGASLNALHTCRATADSRNADGKTPLHVAAEEGRTAMVELLLLKGADKDGFDVGKRTPLFVATTRGHLATAVALLSAGADVNVLCDHGNTSALMKACRCGYVDIMRVLIEHGADVVSVSGAWSQKSVLHDAAFNNTIGAIDVLVEAGANVEARDRFGGTPLHDAVSKLSTQTALALLKHGADVNAQDLRHSTPLHRAAARAGVRELDGRHGAADMVNLLLQSGADETILNINGNAAVDMIEEPKRSEKHTAHGGMGWFGDEYEEEELFEDEDEDEDEEENEDYQDVQRVRRLLANAPADRAERARRLRVYLVLCRAHPDRMHQLNRSSSARIGVSRRTCSAAKQARAEGGHVDGSVGDSTVEQRTGVDWANVVAKVVALQEEGIFRTIVGYL